MGVLPLTLVLFIIFGWCLLARLLQRAGLTAPIVFVAAGFVLAEGLDILDLALEPHLVKVIAEVTLVWVLFADASRRDLVAVIAFTVQLSVLAHGFSGGPLAKRFKESPDRSPAHAEP